MLLTKWLKTVNFLRDRERDSKTTSFGSVWINLHISTYTKENIKIK